MVGYFKSKAKRKGQSAGSAAAFIGITTVAIILYILLLPADVRNDLLSDNPSGGTGGTPGTGGQLNISTTLFSQNIGRVNFLNTNEKSVDIPTVRIDSPTTGQVIKAVPNIVIKSALFDKENSAYTLDFDIDPSAAKNLLLSFNVNQYNGPLIILINGKQIFASEITSSSPAPIKLDPGNLQAHNNIKFMVTSPGWAFWKANIYNLENVQITADITSFKNSIAKQYFTVTDAEKNSFDSVRLSFNPVCTVANVGSLSIALNGRTIFQGVADCGTKSFAVLDPTQIDSGTNELTFSTERGAYLLDNINVKETFKKPTYPTFYFDLSEDFFKTKEERATCGAYDGVCPAGCSDTEDADCCFKHNVFWCALPTDNANDRCVSYVDNRSCNLCMTGYYDTNGDPPKNCEGTCGDNTDGVCPSNCPRPTKYYDKDCCFDSNQDNFWCQEVPVTGISYKCRASISSSECNLCPSGFINTNGAQPSTCTGTTTDFTTPDLTLLDNFDVKMTVRFPDDTKRHRVDININGHRISIDSSSIEYTKIIDDFIRQGTNSIEIVPVEDVDIAELKIEIKQIR